ncbi:ATP-binding protein [Clostridium sediminicola]|uniref:sensor histidine kinase n=1 Tax=Clostridium sediminicola TaxID=3114879 RepID=UPI0031F21A8C
MKSIKTKIALSYLVIIVITVLLAEMSLISLLRKYYYSNTKEILHNEITLSADFYRTYLSSQSLKDNIAKDVDIFWKNTEAEVQIIDTEGNVLMDSIGFLPKSPISSTDFVSALSDEFGYDIHMSQAKNENLMSVAYPLKSGDSIVGVIRFITSLKKVDATIEKISVYLFLLGILLIIISTIVSLFIANSITKPISVITTGAENLAHGNFEDSIEKISEDELGKLTDTLNYMSKEIIKNEKLKNDFIASVSHELRTPLTSIKGWAVTLGYIAPDNSDEFSEGLKIIEDETDRLSKLVNELLDFSKLASGNITLNTTQININNFLKDIVKKIAPRSQSEGIKISCNFYSDLPTVNIDKDKITQAIMNIIDNSFKFTPQGGSICLNTKLLDESVEISIEDNGCGIPSDELPHITKKFFKGKNANSKNGIGLSVCKEIISLHNGSIKVNSSEGIGTKVKLYLPIQK